MQAEFSETRDFQAFTVYVWDQKWGSWQSTHRSKNQT